MTSENPYIPMSKTSQNGEVAYSPWRRVILMLPMALGAGLAGGTLVCQGYGPFKFNTAGAAGWAFGLFAAWGGALIIRGRKLWACALLPPVSMLAFALTGPFLKQVPGPNGTINGAVAFAAILSAVSLPGTVAIVLNLVLARLLSFQNAIIWVGIAAGCAGICGVFMYAARSSSGDFWGIFVWECVAMQTLALLSIAPEPQEQSLIRMHA